MILSIVRLLAAVILAFLAGKLISKLKLPSILGWLIAPAWLWALMLYLW